MWSKLTNVLRREEPTPIADELRLEISTLRREIQRVVLENQGLLESQEETQEEPKTTTVKETAMTINYGKSRTGLEDWFATGKKFTAKYNGWNTSNTRIFLIGSGSMSEAQFKKELKALIKAELDGFKMGGRIEGF